MMTRMLQTKCPLFTHIDALTSDARLRGLFQHCRRIVRLNIIYSTP